LTQTLSRHQTRGPNTATYLADYLTRSVRRASGFVLVAYPDMIPSPCSSSFTSAVTCSDSLLSSRIGGGRMVCCLAKASGPNGLTRAVSERRTPWVELRQTCSQLNCLTTGFIAH
jgi:hypothetical protein